jgi:hypothetical protein
MKEETLDCAVRRTLFGGGYETVVRHATETMRLS